jgi:hypothetical protein
MEVIDHSHFRTALSPVAIEQEAGLAAKQVPSLWRREKALALIGNQTPVSRVQGAEKRIF